ncbi:MAG: hypothetical protein KGZ37_08560 [Nitrosarchaeum sp.]|nr:hypothetical protein [Nitrosarchaeum sp.]
MDYGKTKFLLPKVTIIATNKKWISRMAVDVTNLYFFVRQLSITKP